MKYCHTTIQTEAFEKEIEFYLKYAGLTMQRDMRPMGRNMVFLANAEGETEIEIIEKAGACNAGNENLSIGFHAEDLDEIHRELTENDFHPTPFITPVPSVRFFFVKDPAGVTVQFI